jgi:hypothetical protein
MSRKQTKNIMDDLSAMVDTAIGQLASRWTDQNRRISAYKNKEIDLTQADHFLAELAGDVFPWQRFADIRSEFQNPRHTEFQKNSVWCLFNAITEHLKPRTADSKANGLWTMPARTQRLHKACDDFAGITIDTTVTTPTILDVPTVPMEVVPVVAPIQNN